MGLAFWTLKALSTAMGESASDYLVHAMMPQLAVLLGFVAFVIALLVQLRKRRYLAWAYWGTVAMVGVFGTMAADVLHVAFHVPYPVSAALYAAALTVVFFAWWRTEETLSIHTIDSARRELFYWAAVGATFAMGTALGDLTAYTLHLGYFLSAGLFAALIAIPALAFALTRRHTVAYFWFAYVLTRPLGASLADGLGKPRQVSGLGIGSGTVALTLAALIALLVIYLSVTRSDVQPALTLEAEGA